jgi:hypothetical protein
MNREGISVLHTHGKAFQVKLTVGAKTLRKELPLHDNELK